MVKHSIRPLFSVMLALGLVIGLATLETEVGLLEAPSEAAADTVEAKRSASVMSSPGEQSRTVTRVRAGTKLKVLSKKGRWLKVRVNGRTGWITQSNVVGRAARKTVRKNRRRPFVEGRSRRRRKRKPAPRDRVGADTVDEEFLDEEGFEDDEEEDFDDEDFDDDFEEDEDEEETLTVGDGGTELLRKPKRRAKSVAFLDEGDRLYVIEHDGKWTKVENDAGDVGWVRSKDVEGDAYRYEKLGKKAFVGLGYQRLGQVFTSDGSGVTAGHDISSASAVVTLGGELIYDYSEKYLLAADGAYRYVRASPGVRVEVDGNIGDIAYQIHEVDVGARAGYKLSKKSGLAGYGRIGYHYGRFGVNSVEDFEQNIARLPSEILSGVTVGALIDMPRWNDKIAVRAGVDLLMVAAKRTQTIGLEDGQVSDTSALWGMARLDYQWKPNLKLTGYYQYFQSKTVWQGQAMESERGHGATEAQRQDKAHTLFLGVGRSF